MPSIYEIDKNFEIKTNINKKDIKFYSIEEAPFKVFGIFKENGKYRRMPEETAKKVSENVYLLHTHTAGGRVKFITDSDYVAINAQMDGLQKMPHFAFTGSIGFDLYADGNYVNTFVPPCEATDGYENIINFETSNFKGLKEITINFPLYSNVKNLWIGIQEKAKLEEASPYKNIKPVVYYGSSITQGGCASRPGMSYESILSRKFNCDFINLGFSGSAKAEDEMIEYIKNLDMSLFVYDYDYNAPNAEHLEKTREKMFKAIRQKHCDLPVIMMPRPKFNPTEEEKERIRIIETTYNNAISSGDKNVYYISTQKLTKLCENNGTVDNVHPTDFGFVSMAEAVGKVIEKINCF